MSTEHESPPPRIKPSLFRLGQLFLACSVVASAILAGKHLNLFDAPGCGDGSPCDQAAASPFGSVPGLGWPVSFIGLAYFVALSFAWTAAHLGSGVPRALRHLVRLGAAASVLFLLVMVMGGYACMYCIATHVGNFAFLFVIEAAPRAAAGSRRILAWGAAAFAAVTVAELGAGAIATRGVERDFAASQKEIIEATAAKPAASASGAAQGGFTGRYVLGPAQAPIRLVVISDFQCPDCRRIEREIRTLSGERNDLSVSAKHHPFCIDCNPYIQKNPHPNACWAARAAEAAGILRGNDGFWQMYYWLFDRAGSFTDAELHEALARFGYDVPQFLKVMQGPETQRRVTEDIEEARSLGLHYTPMIFINGVELKGWSAEKAVRRAVEALAATRPASRDASADAPPSAAEKHVADWREQPAQTIPPDSQPWWYGPADAKVDIVVWGDYQEPFTAECDLIIRKIVDSRTDTRYWFRHYPINTDCNPTTPVTFHPLTCYMSKAAEAAGVLGGRDGYWEMHDWLIRNQKTFSDDAVFAAAASMDFNVDQFAKEMQSPRIADLIVEDVMAGKKLGLTGVPFVYINNRRVPRWRMDGILEAMVVEAAGLGSELD